MIEFIVGIGAGVMWGMLLGEYRYKRLLVLLARIKSAEKLPDGKFYYIVPESEAYKIEPPVEAQP